MTHTIVKLLINEDGDLIPKEEQVWHLVDPNDGSTQMTFCQGQVYDTEYVIGQAEKVTGKEAKRAKGGITCKDCLHKIKQIKSIKL